MFKKLRNFAAAGFVAVSAFCSNAVASTVTLTADPGSGITDIGSHADNALVAAIVIGTAVIGWGYVKSLIKRGK